MNGLLFIVACFLLLSIIGSFSVYYCGLPKQEEGDFPWLTCMNVFNVLTCAVLIWAAWSLSQANVPVKFLKKTM